MRHEKRDNINFYNGDNMEFMKNVPDKFYELAIIEPPYGIDLANMNMGIGKSKKASKIQNRKWKPKDWDKETPTEEYFAQLFRVSKNQIIWGGNYFDLPPCKHYIIWDKEIHRNFRGINYLSLNEHEFQQIKQQKMEKELITLYDLFQKHPTLNTLSQEQLLNLTQNPEKMLDRIDSLIYQADTFNDEKL